MADTSSGRSSPNSSSSSAAVPALPSSSPPSSSRVVPPAGAAATAIEITPAAPAAVHDTRTDTRSSVPAVRVAQPGAAPAPGPEESVPPLIGKHPNHVPVVNHGDQQSSSPSPHSTRSLINTSTAEQRAEPQQATAVPATTARSPPPTITTSTPSATQHTPHTTAITATDKDPMSPFAHGPFDMESPFMSEPRQAESPTSHTKDGAKLSDSDSEHPSRQHTLLPARTDTPRSQSRLHSHSHSHTHTQEHRRFSDTVQKPSTRPPPRHSRSYRSHFLRQGPENDGRDDPHMMGSIRMGTSALVSALTALPWEVESDDQSSAGEGESDAHPSDTSDAERLTKTTVFPKRPKAVRMHSSLHTIRPRDAAPPPSAAPPSPNIHDGSHKHHRWHLGKAHHLDFPYKENAIARRAQAPGPNEMLYQLGGDAADHDGAMLADLPTSPGSQTAELHQDVASASEDEAAVNRRKSAVLAARLKEVFDLEEEEEVLEELPCWLLRSVMLKGYLFLTRTRICFFAHMPDQESSVIKSGPLWKKNSRTKLNTKFWFMLRNDVLSWYESSNDPYFPKGNVSLQYASSCDSIGGARFKLRTTERNYTFTADTESSAKVWIRVINKVIFKRQQEGETVRLIIPLEAVIDIESGPSLEFAETIEVKVVDSEDAMSVDSYFFASFPDNAYAYERLQGLLDSRPTPHLPKLASETPTPAEHADTASESGLPTRPKSSAGQIIPKIGAAVLRPLRLSGESKSDSRVPIAAPVKPSLPRHSNEASDADRSSSEFSDDEGYPPKQTGAPPPGMEQQQSWRGTWIRNPAAKLFGTSPNAAGGKVEAAKRRRPAVRKRPSVTEVVEPAPTSDDDFSENESAITLSPRASFSTFSQASPRHGEDPMEHQFHTFFALPESEKLLAHFSGSLYRVLPVHGRFFISTKYFGFRSSHLLYKTRMLVPIRDLYGMQAQKAFRFGHSGLIVIIKGYEELFLEFSSTTRRNLCMSLLEERMDAIREAETPLPGGLTEARIMEDLDNSLSHSGRLSGSLSSPLFNSTASSLLDFKPEPMRIVCLTIGSRGDVQPYIALCKGLQAEGHTTIIASHGEYRDWVEGHGIGFESIGGDPAELMQLCVDNGMFTVSFLKEGLQKFRAWLDDLLMSSWEACQGAQIIIESPSAMAGLHIAEALRIPYYRAFTMPWTRTRAYPQAFAVPEHKRGGSYNYMTYVMFDQVFWRAISGQINRWRKQTLNLEATTLDKMGQDKVPFLYNFSPTIVPPPLDWTEWIHVTGYWFLDHADSSQNKVWAPPEGLVEFIDAAHERGRKVVYIGFGSIVVSDPHEMTRCVVEAVVRADVCAILSKGWSDRGKRKDSKDADHEHVLQEAADGEVIGADGVVYPDNIYPIDSIDHSWLFPKIDAACHHGGAGTTGASLRAGIPTIIKPFFGDQAFWAERVESLGVGSGIHKLTVDDLAEALIQATTNERQIAKAKAVGEEIRRERGVQQAIQCIYRDLEYAKSLIKQPGDRLSKVSSSILSTASSGKKRVRQSISQVFSGTDKEGHSDESWSVVSDGGVGSPPTSPRHHSRTPSNFSNSNPNSDHVSAAEDDLGVHSHSNLASNSNSNSVSNGSANASRNPSSSISPSTSSSHLRALPGIGTLVNHLFSDNERRKSDERRRSGETRRSSEDRRSADGHKSDEQRRSK